MLHLRPAFPDDAELLGTLNERLIEDEGHDEPRRGAELVERMRGWLTGGYEAAIGEVDGEPALYALWRPDGDGVHLRQFFVDRPFRRGGHGRAAIDELRRTWWVGPVGLDVLTTNERGIAFWESVGFRPRTLGMRLDPA